MTNNHIISYVKKYFDIKELVSKGVYEKYGEQAWTFFDPRLLTVLLWLRKGLGIPLICNNWNRGGILQQCGFRDNLSAEVKDKSDKRKYYCSAHCRGMALDLSSRKMEAKDMRTWIREHYDECPYPIRIENDVTWLHFDVATLSDELVEFEIS